MATYNGISGMEKKYYQYPYKMCEVYGICEHWVVNKR